MFEQFMWLHNNRNEQNQICPLAFVHAYLQFLLLWQFGNEHLEGTLLQPCSFARDTGLSLARFHSMLVNLAWLDLSCVAFAKM